MLRVENLIFLVLFSLLSPTIFTTPYIFADRVKSPTTLLQTE
jgi:hypothetical protein